MAKETFTQIIQSKTPTLVDFYADWCGPCKSMKPELESLKTMLGPKVRIVKIDVDKNREISERFKVQSIPTLIVFKEGQVKWRQNGVVRATQLQQVIAPLTSN